MTTTFEARDAIARRWFLNWSGTKKTFLQNEKRRPVRGEAYALLTVSHSASDQETLGPTGSRNYLRGGSIVVTLFLPSNEGGTSVADALAEEARNIFEGVSFDGLDVYAAEINEVGTDGEWIVWTVTAPFNYQERK